MVTDSQVYRIHRCNILSFREPATITTTTVSFAAAAAATSKEHGVGGKCISLNTECYYYHYYVVDVIVILLMCVFVLLLLSVHIVLPTLGLYLVSFVNVILLLT